MYDNDETNQTLCFCLISMTFAILKLFRVKPLLLCCKLYGFISTAGGHLCGVSVNYATKAMLEQIIVLAVLAIVTGTAASNMSVTPVASIHPTHEFYCHH